MNQTVETTLPTGKRRYARTGSKATTTTTAAPAPAITRKPAKVQVAGKPPTLPRITKADIVIGLLARPAGATITQMCEATGWQQHSVRGFLAGTVKKKAGATLGSDKTEAGRIYRLTTNDAVPA